MIIYRIQIRGNGFGGKICEDMIKQLQINVLWVEYFPAATDGREEEVRPNNQSTETPKISARAFNSKSETGRFCPSSRESAGTLMSIPAVCNFARSSICFMPRFILAYVTRAPIIFRLPSANFLVFIDASLLFQSISGNRSRIFGNTKNAKETNMLSCWTKEKPEVWANL